MQRQGWPAHEFPPTDRPGQSVRAQVGSTTRAW
jgi:hypothetical protein